MSLTYTGTGGIFTVLGKYFFAIDTLNTARETTIAAQIQDAVNTYKLDTAADLEFDIAVAGLQNSEAAWRSSGASLVSAIASSCQGFLVQSIRADSLNNRLSIIEALEYLLEQMLVDDNHVDPSVASVAVAADGGNSSTDLAIISTDIGKLGRQLDHIFPEVIKLEVATVGDSTTLNFLGERSVTSKRSEAWPDGSGALLNLSPLTFEDSVIINGDFELATIPDLPDDWIPDGIPGTSFRMTINTVQTVSITGTPTSGSYHIKHTDPVTSLVYATQELIYNASGDDVQSAMRNLPGLAEITVETTGTSPDFTHTITFTGLAGMIATLMSAENMSPGAIVHAVIESGDVGPIAGRAVFIDKTAVLNLSQAISLDLKRVYALGLWVNADTYPSNAIDIVISLHNGFGGTILKDEAGTDQVLNISQVLTKDTHISAFFQVADSADAVHLSIIVSGNGNEDLVIDNMILAPATQFYPGGPYVAMFQGRIPPEIGDKWTITAANDYAGAFQQKFNQVFPMAENGLLLRTAGTTNIPDSLIS